MQIFSSRNEYTKIIYLLLISIIISFYYTLFSEFNYKFNLLEKFHLPVTIFFNYFFILFFISVPFLYLIKKISYFHHNIVLIVISTSLFTFLTVDYFVFQSFKFHVNSFVIKVLTSDNALSVLGLESDIIFYLTLYFIIYLFISMILFCLCAYLSGYINLKVGFLIIYITIILFVFIDKTFFSFLSFKNYGYEVTIRKNVPLYIPVEMHGDFKRLGFKKGDSNNIQKISLLNNEINYPLKRYKPHKIEEKKRYNIIMIVVDALRHDYITQSIMPETRKIINNNGLEFLNHYSGSNGTANGLFSLFFGIPASYLEYFGKSGIQPIFFKFLLENDYDSSILASQPLNYWNIKDSIFFDLKKNIKDNFKKGSVINDSLITNEGIQFIEKNKNNNFFLLLLYDSPHLPYFRHEKFRKFIPDERIVNFNPNNRSDRINGLNSYKNSVNYIDSLVSKIFKKLKQEELFENSIVVLTADHGSEKYEHGHWGHASAFTKEQIKVPFWLLYPKSGTHKIKKFTDHHDFVTTIFELMGEKYGVEYHSIGKNMISETNKEYHIASSHSNWVVFNEKYKVDSTIFEGYSFYKVTDIDDNTVADENEILDKMNPNILNSFKERGKFLK